MLFVCEIFCADNRVPDLQALEGCSRIHGMSFGQAQKQNAVFFLSAKRENVHATSRLDLNLNILQVRSCSVRELFLQLISNEREK